VPEIVLVLLIVLVIETRDFRAVFSSAAVDQDAGKMSDILPLRTRCPITRTSKSTTGHFRSGHNSAHGLCIATLVRTAGCYGIILKRQAESMAGIQRRESWPGLRANTRLHSEFSKIFMSGREPFVKNILSAANFYREVPA